MKNLASFTTLFLSFIIAGCNVDTNQNNQNKMNPYANDLGTVGAFSEMINAGVKQLALSTPLPPEEMDDFIMEAEKLAAKHQVKVYREPELLITDLFPEDVVDGKEVLVLFQGTTLDQYLTLKADQKTLQASGDYDEQARIDIARRFGRLLSYSPRKINRLLAQHTSFRTMDDFGIRATNLFLYYKDLEKAGNFYTKVLGMELLADYEMALILRMSADTYLILVDADKGMHTAEEPKTVALALLTDQLDEWYDYLKTKNVTIKYDYKPKDKSAHDGFVAIDPEGYLLEFERFNQHPENERFMPVLKQNTKTTILSQKASDVPDGLGFHSTITWVYHNDLLGMQHFYEDVLGLEMIADQGWTKIYQASNTGFIGLVDERRGMHKFSEKKAVNVGFIIDKLEPWFNYVQKNKPFTLRENELSTGPETRYKAFVGYGPEGYYLEFDRFFPHADNEKLLEYLREEN